jgi:hypothetical protein
MPDLTTIVTSAAVAAVISSSVGFFAASRQRTHEANMQKLADARVLRDRQAERLWRGLMAVAQMGIDLLDSIRDLMADPRRTLPTVSKTLSDADDKLDPVRAELVLDADAEALLRKAVECAVKFRSLAVALQYQMDTADQHGEVTQLMTEVETRHAEVRAATYDLLTEARALLTELGQPIGAEKDVRSTKQVTYVSVREAESK